MSNNYYQNAYSDPPHNSYAANAYHDHDRHRREEAPLPPLPYSSSPAPFADPYRQPSTGQSSRYDPDPYEDQNAIPLAERERKHGSMHSVAPILPPQHPDDDPFVRDAKPGKRRRRDSGGRSRGNASDDDDGWFRGKITWCCFFFSIVQLIVFLVEIIKYGEYNVEICLVLLGPTFQRAQSS